MAQFKMPLPNEGKKAYLFRAFGIGKGGGKGRISAEGHAMLEQAISKGATFPEPIVAAKAPRVKVSTAPPKPVIPTDRKAEAQKVDPAAIREWAKGKGIAVSERGRISAETTLAYLADVPEGKRDARSITNGEKDLRQAAPRVHPVGTTWRADFTNFRGEKETLILSDRTACGNCRVSLSHCGCARPFVTVGYEKAGTIRLTTIDPKD